MTLYSRLLATEQSAVNLASDVQALHGAACHEGDGLLEYALFDLIKETNALAVRLERIRVAYQREPVV